MSKVSKNFDSWEFSCGCGCGYEDINPKLVDKLQMLRDLVGKPIVVTSGCRCKAYNKHIGGVYNSPHLLGLAADIYCKGIDIRELAGRADLIFSRIGLYPDNHFIHVDIVPPSPSKFWVRHNGKYKYFRPPYNHYDDVMYYMIKNNLK